MNELESNKDGKDDTVSSREEKKNVRQKQMLNL